MRVVSSDPGNHCLHGYRAAVFVAVGRLPGPDVLMVEGVEVVDAEGAGGRVGVVVLHGGR